MPDDAKVLVVDDDPVTRTCLAEYFAAENYAKCSSPALLKRQAGSRRSGTSTLVSNFASLFPAQLLPVTRPA
ncbi:hypothetical protein GPA22_10340 [Aromatoleum toluvorans]|uniref:Response regulatory domain-containing protein n=1 Tax=Aromatoleum toluvorans TaxID=92002 RepID=A0ABX1PXN3_9RHOO|nr:hypothetical protein [Aromatoleum toluvorans]NMG44128.1 hypothetical protein [Aromatoleum toluvorans]